MRRLIVLSVLLGGCSAAPILPGLTPYRIDVQQGNHVTQEMVAKLKPGMTRAQVRFVLGTPLVVDPFREDRWDYVYLYNKAGRVTEQRHMSVVFKDDKLVRVEGDVVPAPTPSAAAAAKPKPAAPGGATDDRGTPGAVKPDPAAGSDATSPQPAPAEEKGFFGRMLEKLGF